MQRPLLVGLIVTSALVAAITAAIAAPSRNQPASQPAAPQPANIGAMLHRGLIATEGCLGVETATTASGKDLIMAWFEDADAARRWYNHPAHRRMVGMFGAEPKERALEHVADGTPVLVIASLTMSPDNPIQGSPIPISQIAIELYTPLPGGAFVNGRLAPATLHVDHMTDYTTDVQPPADAPTEPTQPADT